MKWKLVLVGVERKPTNESVDWEPTRKDVAESIKDWVLEADTDEGWKFVDVVPPHLDRDTLVELIKEANLNGEDTGTLIGELVGASISRWAKGLGNAAP